MTTLHENLDIEKLVREVMKSLSRTERSARAWIDNLLRDNKGLSMDQALAMIKRAGLKHKLEILARDVEELEEKALADDRSFE